MGVAADLPPLELGAKSAIIVEASTGIPVFEKDADAKRFPASTTKIMTALLLLEPNPALRGDLRTGGR